MDFNGYKLTRSDAPSCWSKGGNGHLVLPLTGEHFVRLIHYTDCPFPHLEVCGLGGEVLGWCRIGKDAVAWDKAQRLVELRLSRGDGPRDLANWLDAFRVQDRRPSDTPNDLVRIRQTVESVLGSMHYLVKAVKDAEVVVESVGRRLSDVTTINVHLGNLKSKVSRLRDLTGAADYVDLEEKPPTQPDLA